MTDPFSGRCLCGAVRVTAGGLAGEMSACHCDMCRRWSGSVLMIVEGRGVSVTGPVKTYASSSFAERAWCDRCGSSLWIRDLPDGAYELCAGLFDNAGGARLVREVYADKAPEGYAFAGAHDRVTAAAYEAAHRHVGDDR